MIPASFEYIKASSVDHAIDLLAQHGDDAKILSGGHSLIPAMKLRLNSPEILIDIGRIPELESIVDLGDEISVGANCTHDDIISSPLVRDQLNVLAQTAETIGDLQVRNKGTIGGSLAHADPAADYPAVVLASEARVQVKGKGGQREIAAADFFDGIYTTALGSDEIITAIIFPKAGNGVYLKFPQPASRFAIVGCAAIKKGDGIRVGITGVADTAYRAKAVEEAYQGDVEAAAAHVVDGVEVMGDHFASSEYRSHLAKVFTARAIRALS